MSSGAVRTNSSRRHARNNNASPYARLPQTQKKTSVWGIAKIFNRLNPFASRTEEEPSPPAGDAASRLAARGQELHSEGSLRSRPQIQPHQEHSQPPTQPPHQPPRPVSQSPPNRSINGDQRTSPPSDDSQAASSTNLKKVQQFLDEKGGRPLNHVELAGLVHLLQNSVEDDDERPEPFRFSKSPSTPLRGTTPVNFLSPGTSEQAAGSSAAPRKTLAKNPMGVYRWQGGGSARPRNRYQSPSFGTTPQRTSMKLVPEKPKTDSKRRRVGDDAVSSSTQRAGPSTGLKPNDSSVSTLPTSVSAPAALSGSVSTNGFTNGRTNGRVNGASAHVPPATPRLRTTGIKPTTPAVPSPLRQTWGQTDSPPQTPPQRISKPTRAASFMTELIKEVTPPKKPDFANPYEAANPMIKPAPKKRPVRRTRAAAKTEAETQKKEPELTPQAIIEATVPKGSKRSRPPPEMIGAKPAENRVTSPPTRRSTRINGAGPNTNGINGVSKSPPKVTVEEVSDEDLPSPPKKQRKSPLEPFRKNGPIIIEVDDVEMSSTPSSRAAPAPSYTLPSEVIEPGDDKTQKKRSTSPTPIFGGFGPSRPAFSPPHAPAPAASTPFSPLKPTQATGTEKPKDPRAFVAALREDGLPKYSFTLPLSSPGAGPSTSKAQQNAKAAPVSSLPTYDFNKAPALAPSFKPSGGFNWAAAGVKPPKPAGDSWTCSVCMLSNSSDTVKCTVCEEPRADKPKSAPVQGFNWAAAGLAHPPKAAGAQWTCSVCMLSNPNDASKCTVCDAPR
ncbi:hypothetical protein C8Q74DRAFT_1404090 [Fomes fomentarius]|nr:hypothetical protein C8Q74DRAFT_1404090 [Fomes fomentarius]